MRRLDTEQEAIAKVAEKWKSQYFFNDRWGFCRAGDSGVVHDKLSALGPEATAADVAAIIGNDSWIGERCSECDKRAVILLGDEPDYESATVYLCAACAKRAAELANVGSKHV